MCECIQAFQMLDRIAANVDDAKLGVGFESGEVCQGVVRYVQLLEIGEVREAGYGSQSVRLDREDLEIGQGVETLDLGDLVLA